MGWPYEEAFGDKRVEELSFEIRETQYLQAIHWNCEALNTTSNDIEALFKCQQCDHGLAILYPGTQFEPKNKNHGVCTVPCCTLSSTVSYMQTWSWDKKDDVD